MALLTRLSILRSAGIKTTTTRARLVIETSLAATQEAAQPAATASAGEFVELRRVAAYTREFLSHVQHVAEATALLTAARVSTAATAAAEAAEAAMPTRRVPASLTRYFADEVADHAER